MRVLFVTHAFPRFSGDAAGSFVLRLAHALDAHGISIRVIAPGAPGLAPAEVIEGIPVSRFRYAPRAWENLAYTGEMAERVAAGWSGRLALGGFLAADVLKILPLLRGHDVDLVHAHWWFPSGLVAASACGVTGTPLVVTLHGSDVRLARTIRPARRFYRSVARRARALTSVSAWLADEALQLSGPRPVVAPMPVNTELFVPVTERTGHRPSLPPERSRDRLLFVGRLNRQKGLHYVLEALPALRARAVLDVVGDGPDREALEAQAMRLGLAERVTWHGRLAQHELPPLYRRAAVLVMPSTEEGLGLTAVEAQLCETPVIAFASGGVPDVVENGRTGLLVRVGDVTALTRAIESVLTSPRLGAELGAAGRAAALSGFAPDAVARRYAAIYRNALGQDSP